jgi:hypothetical protein
VGAGFHALTRPAIAGIKLAHQFKPAEHRNIHVGRQRGDSFFELF